ncbi:DUF4439 domain-containing protein, partial [Streptomyces sp. SID7909]|nr:DUF4439 domain-containing protein [Streptomyces sp. SID7909]
RGSGVPFPGLAERAGAAASTDTQAGAATAH